MQMIEQKPPTTVLAMRPRADFVNTKAVQGITERSLAYLRAGYPIHFRGPAGTGKTTLAMHVATQLERPLMLMSGDETVSSADLVGSQSGYRYRKVVDRFIHSVLKYEEDAQQQWVDNRLTIACREGFTLVYDEFTRSRPEANNALLTAIEERLLILPAMAQENAYIKVHPEFRIIFTSNPQEYSGVHTTQDALSDRMVTLDIDYYGRETEIEITSARSSLPLEDATKVVDVVRAFREQGDYDQAPTLRASIMIARVSAMQAVQLSAQDELFVNICLDVLGSKVNFNRKDKDRRAKQQVFLKSLIQQYC